MSPFIPDKAVAVKVVVWPASIVESAADNVTAIFDTGTVFVTVVEHPSAVVIVNVTVLVPGAFHTAVCGPTPVNVPAVPKFHV